MKGIDKDLQSLNINWYPGHMAKTKREIGELMPLIDIVFELIDSRIPFSSKIHNIDEMTKGKPKILIMTKSDLCDKEVTEKWIKKYESDDTRVLLVNLNDNNDYKKVLNAVKEISDSINEKRAEKGMKPKEIKALVVGIPNVGKSTFINRIVGRKVANVGNKPGVTTNLVWLKTNANILLLDTPGILWPKIDSKEVALNLSAMSAIRSEVIPTDEVCIHILEKLAAFYPDVLKSRYNLDVEDLEDIMLTYEKIGRKIGALIKGGEVDFDRVSNTVVNDMKNEAIKNITFDRVD